MPWVADVEAWLLNACATKCAEGGFILSYQQKFEKIFGKRSRQSNMTVRKKSGVIYVCLCTYKLCVYGSCAYRETKYALNERRQTTGEMDSLVEGQETLLLS